MHDHSYVGVDDSKEAFREDPDNPDDRDDQDAEIDVV